MATYTTGDTSPDLTGTCTSNGTAASLTGADVVLHIRKPSGTVLSPVATVDTPASGVWSYSWQAGDLDEPGTWRVEAQATYSSGAVQTFGPASFTVVPQIA